MSAGPPTRRVVRLASGSLGRISVWFETRSSSLPVQCFWVGIESFKVEIN